MESEQAATRTTAATSRAAVVRIRATVPERLSAWTAWFVPESFVDGFSDGRHEFDFVVAEGGNVVTIGHYRGHQDGELMGVPATGNEVSFTVMHIDRVENGRIIEHRGIGDINAMWAQLGVQPPAAG